MFRRKSKMMGMIQSLNDVSWLICWDGRTMIQSEQCLQTTTTAVMGCMDHDAALPMVAGYCDGMDRPWYKVNAICWPLWSSWMGHDQSERCWLTIAIEWMGHDTKWMMCADYFNEWMDHDTQWTMFSYYFDAMDWPWYNVTDGCCWLFCDRTDGS